MRRGRARGEEEEGRTRIGVLEADLAGAEGTVDHGGETLVESHCAIQEVIVF